MRRYAPAIALLFLALAASPALADAKIGDATRVEKQVSSERIAHLSIGDPVYANETISTAAASKGVFTFEDRTTLQVGPSSKVKLNSFIYSAGSGKNVTFNAAKGLFRFVSSPGAHEPYQVKTPTALIGVRGTVFFVRVRPGATDAGIERGSIEVCPKDGGACQVLDTPCTFVTVTPSGMTQPKAVGKDDWSFDGQCSPARRADNPDSPPPPNLPSFGGPTIGVTLGSMIGDTRFADPQPLNGGSFLGGLKLGYDFMFADKFLVGFETDSQYHSEVGGGAGVSSSRVGYIGTARARLGYAVLDRAILYGTGGFAYGNAIAPQSFAGNGLIVPGYSTGYSKDNAVLPGYAVGGGVQYALGGGVSLRAEYLYLHLAHADPVYGTAWGDRGVCNISAAHGVRLGVDFSLSPDTLKTLQSLGH
jgi:opacity protein-like surface antigen